MEMMENTKGALVSPIPLKTPSKMIRAANMGSETATMRSTVIPPAMTCASSVNRDIICPGKANRSAPVTVIRTTAMAAMVLVTCLNSFSSRFPRALPAMVEAAACMP